MDIMASDVFRVDWFLVDTVIIIVLFVMLIGVKIFKSTHRWRQNYSNEFLDFHNYPTASKLFKGQVLKTKQWTLTRNASLKKKPRNNKTILLLGGYYKRKLAKILTEGLSSYGFNVINLKLRNKREPGSKKRRGLITAEIQSLFSLVINFFNQEGFIESLGYLIIDCSRVHIPIKAYLPDQTSIGTILINPKISKKNVDELGDIINISQYSSNVFYIFSLKSILFLRNRSLTHVHKNYQKEKVTHVNIKVLDKSNRKFKYYETILLGMIIDVLENKLMKSKI